MVPLEDWDILGTLNRIQRLPLESGLIRIQDRMEKKFGYENLPSSGKG